MTRTDPVPPPDQPRGASPRRPDAPISLEAEASDLLEALRSYGTVDDLGNPIIEVADDVQWAMDRTQAALDDPLRSLIVREATNDQG